MSKFEKAVQYDNQNYYQLAAIQSAALGFSFTGIGREWALKFGPGTAVCSIIVGNLILWLVSVAIISMVDRRHSTAIDNIRTYFGKSGGLFAAVILVFAFLNWYSFQLSSSLEAIDQLLSAGFGLHNLITIRVGAGFGFFIALLAIGGIRFLRMISVVGLPLLACFYIYAFVVSGNVVSFTGTWGISFSSVLSTILILLPGVINYPTFFRHSRSKSHSFFALTLILLFVTAIEISTVWIGFHFATDLIFNVILMSFYVFFIMVTCNLVNIYLASACWETIVPKFSEAKGFAILGLCGTLTYTFVQISPPVKFLQDLTNSYIGILGVVLLLSYLMRIVIKHRPRNFERVINFVTWLFGCAVATLYESQDFLEGVEGFIPGMNASILFYLCVVFIEETVWALRVKYDRRFLKYKRAE